MNEDGRPENGDFDAQHHLLGALLDAYEASVLDGAPRQLVVDTLGHVVDFSAVHFAEEEGYMASHACPHLERHRAAHVRLLAQFEAMEREARAASKEVAVAGVALLRRLLDDHLEGPDRELAAWTAQRRQPSQTT